MAKTEIPTMISSMMWNRFEKFFSMEIKASKVLPKLFFIKLQTSIPKLFDKIKIKKLTPHSTNSVAIIYQLLLYQEEIFDLVQQLLLEYKIKTS